MSPLESTLRKTRRRLLLARSIQHACSHLAFLLVLIALVMFLDKTGLLVLSGWTQSGLWQGGQLTLPNFSLPAYYALPFTIGVAASLLTAVWRAWREELSLQDTALFLDNRLHCKERLTSALHLPDSTSPMAAPLRDDANRQCANVQPSSLIPLLAQTNGRHLLRCILAVALVAFLLPTADVLGVRASQSEQRRIRQDERNQVKAIALDLRRTAKLLQTKENERKIDPEALKKLTQRMTDLAKKLEQDRTIDPKQARALVHRLQEKMNKDLSAQAMAERLQSLKTDHLGKSLARTLGKRLRNQDYDGARRTLKRMRRQLQKGQLDQKQLQQLSKDLRELSKQMDSPELQRLSKSLQEMADNLDGLQESSDKWKRMQDKLSEMLQGIQGETPDLSKLTEEERKMLRRLQEAMQQLEYTDEQLKKMAELAEQGKAKIMSLEELKKMLQAMKNGNKGDCGDTGDTGNTGDSCGAPGGGNLGGMGGLPGAGRPSGQGNGGQNTGNTGAGSQHVKGGRRPQPLEDPAFDDSRIRARQIGRGTVIGQFFVRGEAGDTGEAKTAYSQAVKTATSSAESVHEREKIPPHLRKYIRDYHNAIKQP